ncbi:MAG: hypothetical protein JWR02_3143 [Mucilaginibacter sp.]|nr:hypothetical protein [Mucilaginibacter sp.]
MPIVASSSSIQILTLTDASLPHSFFTTLTLETSLEDSWSEHGSFKSLMRVSRFFFA